MSNPESMFDLFVKELKVQTSFLLEIFPTLLETQTDSEKIDILLRVTHSIKGIASVVGYMSIGKIAKAMEKCFSKVREQTLTLDPSDMEVFSEAISLFQKLSTTEESKVNDLLQQPSVNELYNKIKAILLAHSSDKLAEDEKDEKLIKKSKLPKLEFDHSMFHLFQSELEAQVSVLTENLLAIEAEPANTKALEQAMDAAQAIKGASRVVKILPIVDLAYTLENYFLAFQKGAISFDAKHFQMILTAVDFISKIRQLNVNNLSLWLEEELPKIESLVEAIQAIASGESPPKVEESQKEKPTIVIPSKVEKQSITKKETIPIKVESKPLVEKELIEVFQSEVENQIALITDTLLALENQPNNKGLLEEAIRAAHTIKGVARTLNMGRIVDLAHALEDCFVAAQEEKIALESNYFDNFFEVLDFLSKLQAVNDSDIIQWLDRELPTIQTLIAMLNSVSSGKPSIGAEKKTHEKPAKTMSPKEIRKSRKEELPPEANAPAPSPPPPPREVSAPVINKEIIIIFQSELETQLAIITDTFLNLENQPKNKSLLEKTMRAAHTIKGAARTLNMTLIVDLAHTLEDCFVAAQEEKIILEANHFDVFFEAIDLLSKLRDLNIDEVSQWLIQEQPTIESLIDSIRANVSGKPIKLVEKKPIIEPEKSLSAREKPKKETTPAETPPPKLIGAPVIDHELATIFQFELETQLAIITDTFLVLENQPKNKALLEKTMRAAHTIKGAARTLNMTLIVELAHALEDCFVAAQEGKIILTPYHFDLLFQSIDLLSNLRDVNISEMGQWLVQEQPIVNALSTSMREIASGRPASLEEKKPFKPIKTETPIPQPIKETPPVEKEQVEEGKPVEKDRVLRVTAQNLNRLMGLVGESLVESRWLQPFGDSLNQLKTYLFEVSDTLDGLVDSLENIKIDQRSLQYLKELVPLTNQCRVSLSDRMVDLEMFKRRHTSLSDRLYQEVIDCRMRPFADGISGFPRMVRDIARQLGKKVRFEVTGLTTPVDREILEKLEAPLNHLIRNALDHGIETPEERLSAGKPEEGTLQLSARHLAGMLVVTLKDNGQGVNLEKLSNKIIEKKLATPEHVEKLSEAELLNFLFLPGFSTAKKVTDISGRGVGLNVLQTMINEVGGSFRLINEVNKGTTFILELPTTLSVIRALIVEISGGIYAFPLARIDHAILVPKESVYTIENRLFFTVEEKNIGIILASQVLDLKEAKSSWSFLPVIVVSDRTNTYGLLVNSFIGEKELVVQEIDPRFGKVPNISTGAFLEDGSPILIVDVEAMVKSTDNLLTSNRLKKVSYSEEVKEKSIKRILVVDDSITVREVESRLLKNRGYEVETAIDGKDGWNAIRSKDYDLIVTDIDMPNLNGFELVRLIKGDLSLKDIPVMIVSYKESEEDRRHGLEVGANYYLSKSSFQDETLINIVNDLIGPPQ